MNVKYVLNTVELMRISFDCVFFFVWDSPGKMKKGKHGRHDLFFVIYLVHTLDSFIKSSILSDRLSQKTQINMLATVKKVEHAVNEERK